MVVTMTKIQKKGVISVIVILKAHFCTVIQEVDLRGEIAIEVVCDGLASSACTRV